jgi:hypothetical protein
MLRSHYHANCHVHLKLMIDGLVSKPFGDDLAFTYGKFRVPVIWLTATIFSHGGWMANLKGLESIVSQLRQQRADLVNQLRHVDAALSVLGRLNGGRFYTKPRRRLSASARRKIAAAQRARWAKQKASAKRSSTTAAPKRHISAAGRTRIAAAARARWAKVKRQKKAA